MSACNTVQVPEHVVGSHIERIAQERVIIPSVLLVHYWHLNMVKHCPCCYSTVQAEQMTKHNVLTVTQ